MSYLVHPTLALALAYLSDFVRHLGPVWGANACLLSLWEDGSIDQAIQALRAHDPEQAVAMLKMANEQASEPVAPDEHQAKDSQGERQRIALAVGVALALVEPLALLVAPTKPEPEPEPEPDPEELAPLELPEPFVLDIPDLDELAGFPPSPGAPTAGAAVALNTQG